MLGLDAILVYCRKAKQLTLLCAFRKHAASPTPGGATPAPATAASSRKQKPSPANRGLHRQTVTSQAVHAQQHSEIPKQSLVQAPQGSDGQGSGGKAAQETNASQGEPSRLDSAAPERTSSGGVLNPFASTFFPHTNSSNMLSSSSATGSP